MMNPSPLPAEDAASATPAAFMVPVNGGLRGIILSHVDSPTTLVRAALVSKRWLREVSHPTFLRRFGELHPPRLLGFYFTVNCYSKFQVEFVSLPARPPQQRFDAALCAAVRRMGSAMDRAHPEARWNILDVRNGRILFTYFKRWHFEYWRFGLGDPLRRPGVEGAMAELPWPPTTTMYCGSGTQHTIFLPEEEDDDVTCYHVDAYTCSRRCIPLDRDILVRVSVLRRGAWDEHCSVRVAVPRQPLHIHFNCPKAVLAGGKVYMVVTARYIVVVDLAAPGSGSTFELPEGVALVHDPRKVCNLWLCRGDGGSGVCLVHTEEGRDELRVWLHRGGGSGGWVLKDAVSLNQTCGPLADESFDSAYDRVRVVGARDSAEFVFLVLGRTGVVACLHVGTTRAEKVHEFRNLTEPHAIDLHPLMTVWPPTFPAAASQDGTSAAGDVLAITHHFLLHLSSIALQSFDVLGNSSRASHYTRDILHTGKSYMVLALIITYFSLP